MKKIIACLFGLLVFLPSISMADDASTAEFAKNLQQTESMTANFRQVVTDTKGRFIQQSSGNMALKRPSKFRWYTHHPTQQLIVANGDKLWIYDKDLDQLTIQHLEQTNGSATALLLSDSVDKVKASFQIELLSNAKKKQVFKLTPLNKENIFKWVKLYFESDKLKEIRYLDHMDQSTDIQFLNVDAKAKLNDSLFKLTPPKGVDIIDNYSVQK